MRNEFAAMILTLLLTVTVYSVDAASVLTEKGYILQKVLILSRHNIRASLASNIEITHEYSNRQWGEETFVPGHLTSKGGTQETLMGGFYRHYFEDEKFIPVDWQPDIEKVRFYANSYQRTVATAKFFAVGLAPMADVHIEYHKNIDERDPVFLPSSKISDPKLAKQAADWMKLTRFGKQKMFFHENEKNIVREIERIVDFKNSPFAKYKRIKHFDDKNFTIELNKDKAYKKAEYKKLIQLADSVIMRYYDNPNDKEVVWNIHKPQRALKAAGMMLTEGGDAVWKNPAFAKHMTRNLLPEIIKELNSGHDFIFFCGHDTNLATLLAAINVEDYELPNTIMSHTPIGGKIVIEKRKGKDGRFYAGFDMIYSSDKQLRNLEVLNLQNPPMKEPLIIKGLNRNLDGLYDWDEFEKHLVKSQIQ